MSESPYFDDFGNLNSIISKERRCFFCGCPSNLQIHHVFGGAFRGKSTEYGLFVFLCPKCHAELHFGKDSRAMQDRLKSVAQARFCRLHSKKEFMEEFGRGFPSEAESIDVKDMGF